MGFTIGGIGGMLLGAVLIGVGMNNSFDPEQWNMSIFISGGAIGAIGNIMLMSGIIVWPIGTSRM